MAQVVIGPPLALADLNRALRYISEIEHPLARFLIALDRESYAQLSPILFNDADDFKNRIGKAFVIRRLVFIAAAVIGDIKHILAHCQNHRVDIRDHAARAGQADAFDAINVR